MNIVLSGDEKYVPYMAVTIVNIRAHIPKKVKLNFHILYSSVNKEPIILLSTYLQKKVKNSSISICNFTENRKAELRQLSKFSHGEHVSSSAYGLFFVADLFPDIQKALYLDVDIYIMTNLLSIYEMELGNCYAGVIEHLVNSFHADSKITKNGMIFSEYFKKYFGKSSKGYFNTGIQLLNLKKMREDNVADSFIREMNRIGIKKFKSVIEYHNQDFINAVFHGSTIFFPLKYNMNPNSIYFLYNRNKDLPFSFYKELEDAICNPAIIHYTGVEKPWNNLFLRKSYLWWMCAIRTPFFIEIVKSNYIELIGKISLRKIVNNIFQIKIKKRIVLIFIVGKILIVKRKY